MSNVDELLTRLNDLGVALWNEDGKLRYRAPAGIVTPDLRDELTRFKPQLIEHLQNSGPLTPGRIPRAPRHELLPLSFAQERLWFMDRLQGGSVYNMPIALRIQGPLDMDGLERAVNTVIARHEILRTNFSDADGRAVQAVSTLPAHFRFECMDLHGHEDDLTAQLHAEFARPFSLEDGPLLRGAIFRTAEDSHTVLIVVHHIVCDGWSSGIFLRELTEAYRADLEDREPNLPELPLQYADYAVWQRRRSDGRPVHEAIAFWKTQLEAAPKTLDLPSDRPRPPVQTFIGRTQRFQLDHGLSEELRAIAQRYGATLFATLLAAWAAFIARYSGATSFIVGCPVANRTRTEIADLIGFFVNTLPLRIDAGGDPDFATLLRRVQQTVLAALAHQDFPVEKLLEELHLARDLSRNPLVQVAFALGGFAAPAISLPGLEVQTVEFETGTARTDLSLIMEEGAEGLVGSLEFMSDLFSQETIAQMVRDFEQLLRSVAADPLLPLSRLPEPTRSRPRETNLTANQFQMWLAHQVAPDRSVLNCAIVMWIPMRIDVEKFHAAFNTIVRSIDALRTVIREEDGVPCQTVLETIEDGFEYRDLSGLPNADEAAQQQAFAFSRLGFDCARRMFGGLLLKLSETSYGWVFSSHHAISDSWSVALGLKLISDLYQRALEGTLPDRIDMPQFAQFVAEDQAFRKTERWRRSEAYWLAELGRERSPLQFYGRRIGAHVPEQRITVTLGKEKIERLSAFASLLNLGDSKESALFTAIAAVLTVLTARIAGRRTVSIGATLHNRRSADAKRAFGLFMHSVPVMIDVDESETVDKLARRIAQKMRESFRHGRYFVRNSIQNPSIDVLLNYQVIECPPFCGLRAPLEVLRLPHGSEPLAVHARDFASEGSLYLDFDFLAECFDEDTRKRTVRYFMNLLDSLLENAGQRCGQLSVLDAGEQRQLEALNPPETPLPENETIVSLIERQVRETPHAVAVAAAGSRLSYEELNGRANRIAGLLAAHGAGPETRVAICLERTVDLVAAVLGILKCGAACVPLDFSIPRARRDTILADSGALLVLTDAQHAAEFPLPSSHVLCLNGDAIAEPDDLCRWTGPAPDNAAYVIYTSGSTGTPKGVVVEHRNAVNAFLGYKATYALDKAATCHLQMSNVTFDIFFGDFLKSLCSGGKLVLVPRDVLLEPAQLYELMRSEQVDCGDFVPAVFRPLAEYVRQTGGTLAFMKVIICGADVWHTHEYREFRALCGPQTRLINTYGVTEATIDSTYFEDPGLAHPADAPLPIGRPVPNVQVHILDHRLEPALVGVPGEMYIGGPSVSRGYAGRPALTAEKFVPDPFSKRPGARLYRTGDAARWLPGGNIEFLGRLDFQAKIRGFRIELGEIEAVLGSQPGVAKAVAVIRNDHAGQQTLAAYVVPSSPAPSVSELRAVLKKKLPDYMVPSAITVLAELPTTPNGKVDRKALPAPHSLDYDQQISPPRTAVEHLLADIWAEVLHQDAVSIDANFFELGGDSILSMQVVSRACKAGIPLTPRDLFQNQTIAELAAAMAGATAVSSPALVSHPVIAGLPPEYEDAYPLSPTQEMIVREYLKHAGEGVYHSQTIWRIRDEQFSPEALESAFRGLLAAIPVLRTVLVDHDGKTHQAVHRSAPLPLRVETIAGSSDAALRQRLDQWLLDDRAAPFTREQLLWRVHVFVLPPSEFALCVSVHHAILDGWSMPPLLGRLYTFYEAARRGVTSAAAVEPNIFREAILTDLARLESPDALPAFDFWDRHLADHLIADHRTSSPSAHVAAGAPAERVALSWTSDSRFAGNLTELQRQWKVSLKSLFLGAYLYLLSEITESATVTAAVVFNGRSAADPEQLFAPGLFWRIAPFRSTVSDAEAEFVRGVHRNLLQADLHSYIPLGTLQSRYRNDDLAFASFNFISIDDAAIRSGSGGIDLLESTTIDWFHFPLNLKAAYSPSGIELHFDADRRSFDRGCLDRFLASYTERLTRISSLSMEAFQ